MFIDALKKTLKDQVKISEHLLKEVSKDRSYAQPVMPSCVVMAVEDKHIQETLRIANDYKVPVTVRGAGSGKSGGAVPEPEGIVLILSGYNKILEIDQLNSCAVVQPGVITDHLKKAASEVGLFYPPDLSSSDWCTIGGNVAENSGGATALKYGVTGQYVLGLEGFLATGEPFSFGGKLHKDVAGYDMKRLLVGSEGTLAIITKIILKLIPQPRYDMSLWCSFESFEKAVGFMQEVNHSSVRPVCIEFMEKTCMDAVETAWKEKLSCHHGEAAVLIRCDAYHQDQLDKDCDAIQRIGTRYQATIHQGEDARYWQIRDAISESLEVHFKHKVSEDITVPPGRIPDYLNAVKKLYMPKEVAVVAYGHLGDGNVHTNIVNMGLSDIEWHEQKDSYIDKVIECGLKMQGTLSGEHGIGLTKKQYMAQYFSDTELSLMKRIKHSFDPHHILNPSKML